MSAAFIPPPRALALAISLAGCQVAASREETDSSASAATPRVAVTPPSADSVVDDSLRLRLEVPREVRAGASVPIVLRAENVTARPLQLYLRGREIAFDIAVTSAGGEVVWRRLENEIIQGILQFRVLQPGEVLELRTEWDQRTARGARVQAGDYAARGFLLTDRPEPLETPSVPLRIAAR